MLRLAALGLAVGSKRAFQPIDQSQKAGGQRSLKCVMVDETELTT